MTKRVAVVTGAGGGIGLGCAEALLEAGHDLALLDLQGAEVAAEKLNAEGKGKVVGLTVDVSDRTAVAAAYDKVRAELGPVTIVVTSAGIEKFTAVTEITPEQWDQIIAVNLTGTFACIQPAIADMVAAKWGRIVTISSQSAQSGAPRMAHYSASKGGVISLTKALAVELAREGITSNTISPSLVDTPMARKAEAEGAFPGVDVVAPHVPVGRAATPADIAAMAAYLCSDAGSYITGQVLGVNGGMYI